MTGGTVHGGTVRNLSNILNSSGAGAENSNGMTDPKFEASRKLYEQVEKGRKLWKVVKPALKCHPGVWAGKANTVHIF